MTREGLSLGAGKGPKLSRHNTISYVYRFKHFLINCNDNETKDVPKRSYVCQDKVIFRWKRGIWLMINILKSFIYIIVPVL